MYKLAHTWNYMCVVQTHVGLSVYMHMYVYVYIYMESEKETHAHTHTHRNMCTYKDSLTLKGNTYEEADASKPQPQETLNLKL